MRELAMVKTMRDSLQTLLLHHHLNEVARGFFKAVRLGNFAEAKSRMSATWQVVPADELSEMIRSDLALLSLSTATHFGLVMDDGVRAVLDTYLYFEGGHWLSCGVSLAQEQGCWGVDTVNLLREDWSPERLQAKSVVE
jgi:hypothetical protein